MNKFYFSLLLLPAVFCSGDLCARQEENPLKDYGVVSVLFSVPDNDQKNFNDVYFKFGWKNKAPYKIAIQLINRSYKDRKIKFALKDVTTKKMILLDAVHNSRFGSEMLKANSEGLVWSGLVDNIKDNFSLVVWNSAGDKFEKEPISINDQQ